MEDLRRKERDAYLAKLRYRAAVREQTRDLQKKAEQKRTQEAADTAVKYLYSLDERSQVRVNIREKRIKDTASHHEAMGELGQKYRGKLKFFVQREFAKEKGISSHV